MLKKECIGEVFELAAGEFLFKPRGENPLKFSPWAQLKTEPDGSTRISLPFEVTLDEASRILGMKSTGPMLPILKMRDRSGQPLIRSRRPGNSEASILVELASLMAHYHATKDPHFWDKIQVKESA